MGLTSIVGIVALVLLIAALIKYLFSKVKLAAALAFPGLDTGRLRFRRLRETRGRGRGDYRAPAPDGPARS